MGQSRHVLAVLFSEFDTKEGPVIASQWPEGFVSKDVWTSLYEYVIPKLDIANRVVSIAHPHLRDRRDRGGGSRGGGGGFRLVGAPMVISDSKYSRNAYTFNLCVALDLRRIADVTRVDAALRALGVGLMDLEVRRGFLHSAADRRAFFARLPRLADTLEQLLASARPADAAFAFADGPDAPCAVLRVSPDPSVTAAGPDPPPAPASPTPGSPAPAPSSSSVTSLPANETTTATATATTATTTTTTTKAEGAGAELQGASPATVAVGETAGVQRGGHPEDVDGMLLRPVAPQGGGDTAGLGGAALELYNHLKAGLCTVHTAARSARMAHDMPRVRECARSLLSARRVVQVPELECAYLVTPLVRRLLVPAAYQCAYPCYFSDDDDDDSDDDNFDDGYSSSSSSSGSGCSSESEDSNCAGEGSGSDGGEGNSRGELLRRFTEYAALTTGSVPSTAALLRLFGLISPSLRGSAMEAQFAECGVSAPRFVRFALAHDWLVPVPDPAVVDTLYCQPNAPNPQMIQHSIFRDQHAFLRNFV